jgi:hypothetical protein
VARQPDVKNVNDNNNNNNKNNKKINKQINKEHTHYTRKKRFQIYYFNHIVHRAGS